LMMDMCVDDPEARLSRQINRQIEEDLRRAKQQRRKTHKLLLLGTGESGKTTFVKQMKILYGGGFTEEEKAFYRIDIINNLVDGMRDLVEGMATLEIEFKGGDAFQSLGRDLVGYKHREGSHELGPGIGATMKRLWGDAGVKECFARRHQLQIQDCVGFFLDNIDRITAEEYEPTNEDILMSRKQTTGVVEHSFTFDENTSEEMTLEFVDVAGQRNKRKKWIDHFDGVTAVIFLVAVSEYNQVLWEDANTNRLTESLNVFKEMLNNEFFTDTQFILFLNKKDLFETKIKDGHHLKTNFPKFTGPEGDVDAAMKYIKDTFLAVAGSEKDQKRITPFDTVAVDPRNIKIVFLEVKNVIFEGKMEKVEI